jgi:hypothetical protein
MNSAKMHDKMARKVFTETLRSKDFISTKQAVDLLDDKSFWSENDIEDAVREYKETFVRRMMRKIKDGRGRPVFANVQITDEQGETTQGYMQQALFDVPHYEYTIQYHEERARHHIRESNEYAKDLKVRYDVQYDLAFVLPDDQKEDAA